MPDAGLLKREYPEGTRVRLRYMDDAFSPPAGTEGTVTFVDDVGTIHVTWDNGSSLGLIYGTDIFDIVWRIILHFGKIPYIFYII